LRALGGGGFLMNPWPGGGGGGGLSLVVPQNTWLVPISTSALDMLQALLLVARWPR